MKIFLRLLLTLGVTVMSLLIAHLGVRCLTDIGSDTIQTWMGYVLIALGFVTLIGGLRTVFKSL